MEYRKLGRTGLEASVIGFGAEWIGKMEQAEVNAMVARGAAAGVNIVDCWMSDPAVRSALGEALEPTRDQWIIQGHIGSTWQDGQYVRTRELDQVRPAFEDLLERLRTDHVELGMIHYVDACDEFRAIMDGPFIEYVRELLAAGKIGHVGLSTHNPEVALLACDEPEIEVIMFSLNPAFDMMPASEDLEDLFGDYENVAGDGIEPVRARLYARAEEKDVARLPVTMTGGQNMNILIGPENVSDALKDTSVVMASYDIGENMKGVIGVVGPTRMDYAKVTARLSYFADSLTRMFGKGELPPAEKTDTQEP